jgi:hypothetical protein
MLPLLLGLGTLYSIDHSFPGMAILFGVAALLTLVTGAGRI